MKAIWKGAVIAESDNTVVVENNHYFPKESIKGDHFEKTDHGSSCPWKGKANYYTIKVGEDSNVNAAWYYAEPKDAAKEIRGRIAFWKGVEVVE